MNVKLKDVASFAKGSQINGEDLLNDAKYVYLNGGINPSGKWNDYNVESETITISEGGNSCGYVNFMKEPFWCGAHCYFLYHVSGNKKYLYYALKSQQNRLMRLRNGACMPNIKKNDLKNFMFTYEDDIEKQEDIVRKLEHLENCIDLSQEEMGRLDLLVKSRFIEMFGDPIKNPRKWKVVTVKDIATDVRYGTSKASVEGGKYPYLRMNNITSDGHLDMTDLKYIDIQDDEKEKCVVRKGDVLFNRTNSIELVGKTAVFNLMQEMVIAGYIIRVRLGNELLPDIFAQYMNLEALKRILRNMAKGAVNQANINAKELQSLRVFVPPLELQCKFIDFAQEVDKSKLAVKESLEKLETMKKALMQQYFG